MLFYLPVHSYSDLYYTSYVRLLSSLPPDSLPDCAPIETRGGNCFSSPTARRSQPKHQTAPASSARSVLLGDVIEALERLAGGLDHRQTRDRHQMAPTRLSVILAMEVEGSGGPSEDRPGDS